MNDESGKPVLDPEVEVLTLFLGGDLMTGRGIDQILPHPSHPGLHEPAVKDAREYVELVERRSGPIPRPTTFDYVWGDALMQLDRLSPDLRIVNLETAVTTNPHPWKGKLVHYRMHPRNMPCLRAAKLHCCVLANNHAMDWGYAGLEETLRTLAESGIQTAVAGRDLAEAQRPATFNLPGGRRVLVFAAGSVSSGIPPAWAATEHRPGIHLFDESSPMSALQLKGVMSSFVRSRDLVILSLHWGPNWSYDIPAEQQDLARELIESGEVHIVHGHSSHHIKGLEIYKGIPILYGCGDFITDYEGIGGHERYRGDLGSMYFARFRTEDGRFQELEVQPIQMRRLQLRRASARDALWLREVPFGKIERFGARAQLTGDGSIRIRPA